MKNAIRSSSNRILCFKIGALGDVLLTTPLIRTLRARFPRAQIDYLTGRWSAPALKNNPHLNQVLTFDDAIVQRRSVAKLLSLAADIRRRKYDVIFVLDPGWSVHVLTTFFGGFRINRRRIHDRVHDIEQYLTLGKTVGCQNQDTKLELTVSSSDTAYAREFLENLPHPRVAVCPGGAKNPYQSMPERRWPPEYYGELIHRLKVCGWGVVVLAGQKISLAQTAAVMAQCNVVVTHDQGLMHVAATTGTPIIALFGPTDPRLKKPLGSQHRLIWKAHTPCHYHGQLRNCGPEHNLANISPAEVLAAVTETLVRS